MAKTQRIAVVGSGISGLSAAWLLSQRHAVTLYEAEPRLGGHTNTIDITVDGQTFPIDTGFLVFNERTYPNLCALFEHLDVPSVASDMSFAVSLQSPRLEWAGTNLATIFAQRLNLLRPAFWRMVTDILRFNRESVAWLSDHPNTSGPSVGDYLTTHGYSREFRDWYLLPMAAAIWSCPTRQMLAYPFATFVRFCSNHGLLQVSDRPQWRTVSGGGRSYVQKMAREINHVRLNTPVTGLSRKDSGVLVFAPDGAELFDQVVLAGHSDQSLRLLGHEATASERRLLGAVRYQDNLAVVHTDPALLPHDAKVWSAWNYLAGEGDPDTRPVSVSYLINRLQPLPVDTPVAVTLNPLTMPAPDKTLRQIHYAHPVFDASAIAAQNDLPMIQGRNRIWYCGAWTGYGFHEDGLKSGMAVAAALGCQAPWQTPAATPIRPKSEQPALAEAA